ncbi:MAG TPA: MaoC family dehydratase N-terminal domain-containing protein [Alphaproteobacteria bacterium]|nr:MaoC family dehydratase N-terminal domain-containing protein [Alphaproteobacteria bacterium]
MNTALKGELAGLSRWVGRREESEDVLLPLHVAGLAAMLDRDDALPRGGDAAPPGAHWLIRPRWLRQSALGADGLPERGGFMPPAPLPRRMWAGSQIAFERPLRVGDRIVRRSEIADIAVKEGRGGVLVFVKVRHRYHGGEGLALTEDQDIVYREAPDPARPAPPPEPAPADGPWRREITPDPVMLYRYSALTYNGHRIHYDHPYVTKVEGYPGLIVHGPLLATLLLDLVRREQPQAALKRFVFRAMAPVFDTAPFTVSGGPDADGRTAKVWIKRADGGLAMRAEASFAAA